jgi:hypothetical protein
MKWSKGKPIASCWRSDEYWLLASLGRCLACFHVFLGVFAFWEKLTKVTMLFKCL